MTHYDTLRVSPAASDADIKRAYRTQARELHPDRSPHTAAGFRQVTEAYAILGDPAKRRAYDRELEARKNPTSEAWRAVEAVVGPIDEAAAEQILDTLFGDMLEKAKLQVRERILDGLRGRGGHRR